MCTLEGDHLVLGQRHLEVLYRDKEMSEAQCEGMELRRNVGEAREAVVF